MNRLVSKNSVLRFKLGKLILKMRGGGNTAHERFVNWISNNIFSVKPTGGGLLGLINGTSSEPLLLKQQSPKDYSSFMKGGTRLRSAEEQKKWEAEVQRLKNLMKNDLRKVINKRRITPRFLSKYSDRMSEIGGVNNIRAWLEKLKNYYDAGTYNPDSVWGANTEKAYKKYLADNNINLESKELKPISIFPVKESVLQNNFAQDKQTGYPSTETIQLSSPVLNLLNDFASDRQNYYPSVTTNIVSYNPNFNWRNALAESQKLHFVKQGGQLYSRNPIKRFKSNFR